MQGDALKAIIPKSRRQKLQDMVGMCVTAARKRNMPIIWTGVQFEDDYADLSPNHRIYGALRRLHDKIPSQKPKWFIKGSSGTQVDCPSFQDSDIICWRSQSLPLELRGFVEDLKVKQVTLIGMKVSHAVQAVCQILCDLVQSVRVVRQAVADDNEERASAVLDNLIPIYADVIDIHNFLVDTNETYELSSAQNEMGNSHGIRYVSNCGRGGHLPIYAAHLLRKSDIWTTWPTQGWYTDLSRAYRCPVGRKKVAFCDEPQFSEISAFIKGRENLDEKEKLLNLHCEGVNMPLSFLVRNCEWVGPVAPTDLEQSGPWFVKEVNKNGGRAVQVCHTLKNALDLTQRQSTYVVQQHIPAQMLAGGHKCHIKLYNLLTSNEAWKLYTYRDGFWSKSANPWCVDDLSPSTQVTVLRTHRLCMDDKEPPHWPEMGLWSDIYQKCQTSVEAVIANAISSGKLQTRTDQKQFEIFSADFMLDSSKQVWLIEFNFTPVLYDPTYFNDSNLTTNGLRQYHAAYKEHGDKAPINDSLMMQDVVELVFGTSRALPTNSKWDPVQEFEVPRS